MANSDIDFDLNLLYSGPIYPGDAFIHLGGFFDVLNEYDKWLLSLLSDQYFIEYTLENVEFGSIRSRVAQIIRGIPDEAIKEFDWKKLVGHFLLKAKYWLLRKLETNPNLDSGNELKQLMNQINDEITALNKNTPIILSFIDTPYILLLFTEKLAFVSHALNDSEKVEYKSSAGNVVIDNGVFVDKKKIVTELGATTVENTTIEILQIKKIDLLSNESKWDFKQGRKSLTAKVLDQVWLDKFHDREFNIQSQDSLKVELKTTYTFLPNNEYTNTHHEIISVLEIIKPQ